MPNAVHRSRFTSTAGLGVCLLTLLATPSQAQGTAAATTAAPTTATATFTAATAAPTTFTAATAAPTTFTAATAAPTSATAIAAAPATATAATAMAATTRATAATTTTSPISESMRYRLYFLHALHLEQAATKAATQTQAQVEELQKAGETKKAAAASALLEKIQTGGWWQHAQSAAHLTEQETATLRRIVDDFNQTFTQKDAETAAAIAKYRARRQDANLKAQAKALWDQGQEILTAHVQQLHSELGDDAFRRLDTFVGSTMQGTTTVRTPAAPAAKAQGSGGRS